MLHLQFVSMSDPDCTPAAFKWSLGNGVVGSLTVQKIRYFLLARPRILLSPMLQNLVFLIGL